MTAILGDSRLSGSGSDLLVCDQTSCPSEGKPIARRIAMDAITYVLGYFVRRYLMHSTICRELWTGFRTFSFRRAVGVASGGSLAEAIWRRSTAGVFAACHAPAPPASNPEENRFRLTNSFRNGP